MIGQKEIMHMHKILWRKKTAFELYYHKQQLYVETYETLKLKSQLKIFTQPV